MVLELKDLKLSFTNAHNKTFNLLNGVNLTVEEGKITALVGGNGAGKTTLFNIISGFQKDYSGEILLDGEKIEKYSPEEISLKGIGRLFQGGQLLDGISLMDNMKIASDDKTGERPFNSLFHPRKVKESELAKEKQARNILIKLFGQECKYLNMLNDDASSFSYGEQRLLSLARLFMGNDKLLLLDEPTSGVNPIYIRSIEKIIRDMVDNEGITVLLIEHNMHFVRNIADICAYLDEGVISKIGVATDVLDDTDVRSSYLGL